MKKRNHNLVCSIVALGLGFLASTTFGAAGQQQLATSINEARAEATRTHEQLEATLSALNALTKQSKGDLRPAYNAFAAEIPKTEAAANSTRTRVRWMGGDGQQYFTGWQKDIDGIANESLRKSAQKRLNAVKKSYDKVAVELTNAGAKFTPFLSDLNDIQKTLANDVTPSGVKAIRSTVSSANWNYKYVNREIHDALNEMARMEKALSTEVK
jgi:hypothetical protein